MSKCPHWHRRTTFPPKSLQNLGLKEESSKCLPLALEKVQAHHRKMQSYSLQTIFFGEGRKEGVGVGMSFSWDRLPHKPGFHQTTFCSRKSYWIILNLNFLQSQFVCLCLCIFNILCCVQVGWVSPRTGLPPFLPSSLQPPVLDTTCYKALPST